MKIYLVGIRQDDGTIDHIRPYTNPTWVRKYAKPAGDAAVYMVIDGEFSSKIPEELVEETSNARNTQNT